MIYEEIPMEEPYRLQLKKAYNVPFRRNITILTCLAFGFVSIMVPGIFTSKVPIAFLIVLMPMFTVLYIIARKFRQYKYHYMQDAEFGCVIKEQMTITKVFHTPAGINIYWLDSDIIKTFTPNPYRHFYEGDRVIIYYLKYSKEYLTYEA